MNLTPRQKYYVYYLVDPRSGDVFYVGKGCGDRIKHHERDARNLRFANTEKEQTIHDIWDAKLSVGKVIVRRFSNEADALAFERMEIARIGYKNLTNISNGATAEIDRSICKAERFVIEMNRKAEMLSGSASETARMLANEMQENLNVFLLARGNAV